MPNKLYKVKSFTMKMKRLLITALFIVIVLLVSGFFVSAQACINSQRIFRISSQTNAHAEEWNH